MIERKYALAAKLETVKGTDAEPAIPTDLIMTSRPQVTKQNRTDTRNHPISGFGDPAQAIIGEGLQITFSCELIKDFDKTSPGTAPKIGVLLQACNFNETVTADTSIAYALDTTGSNGKSLTIIVHHDGLMYKALGCVGTFDLAPAAGGMVIINFTFTGMLAATWVADTAFPSFTVSLSEYLRFHNAASVVGSESALIMNTFNFTLAANVVKRLDAGSANGIKEYYINNAIPTLSIDPEIEALSAHNPFSIMEANTLIDCSTEFKAADGKKCVLTTGGMQITEVNSNDAREMTMVYGINLKAVETEVSLVFS
jgi:hypothetical protein